MRAGEDIDFCWRLQLRGLRLVSAPGAVVAKRERSDRRSRRRQQLTYGRHDALLYRRFREAGMPRNNRLTVKTWVWLLVNAPWAAVSARRRTTWSRAWYLRIGRLMGSWEHRVFFP
jgi:GT2 family glycosyltransferase